MRPLLAVAILVAFTPGVWAEDKKHESKDGKFTIVFPGKPTETVEMSGGQKSPKVALESKGRVFEVLYVDLPEAAKNIPPKTIFDGGEKAALNNGKKLVSSTDFKFGADKLPAREIAVLEGDRMHRAVMIQRDLRFYVIAVGGPNTFTTAKEAYAFFESFELGK